MGKNCVLLEPVTELSGIRSSAKKNKQSKTKSMDNVHTSQNSLPSTPGIQGLDQQRGKIKQKDRVICGSDLATS